MSSQGDLAPHPPTTRRPDALAGRRRALAVAAGCLGGALIAAALLASLLWWRSDADACTCEWCPDRYCAYADMMRAALAGEPDGWSRLAAFGREFVHAHSPLAPALMTPALLAGADPVVAFALVSALATWLAWIAIRRAIAAAFRPPPLVVALVFTAFFTNALVVRSFARPLTDALGLACTAWSLYLLERQLDVPSRARALRLIAAQSIGLFSRVSFIPMLALPALAAVAVPGDRWRDRLAAGLRAGLLYGVLPGLIFLAIANALGIEHVRRAWDYAHEPVFRAPFKPSAWRSSLWLAGGTLLACAAAGAVLGGWPTRAWRTAALWVGLYLGFLALGQGSPFPRYFAPIVPSLAIAAVPALRWIVERSRTAAVLAGCALVAPGLISMSRTIDHRAASLAMLGADLRAATSRDVAAPPGERPLAPSRYSVRSFAAGASREATAPRDPVAAARPPADGLRAEWKPIFQVDLAEPRRVRAIGFPRPIGTRPAEFAIEGSADGTSWVSLGERNAPQRLVDFFAMHPQMVLPLRAAGRLRALRVIAPVKDTSTWLVEGVEVYGGRKGRRSGRGVATNG